ncbi:MAG: N-acetylmuramoyl-L-alanine amidase [Phascolarctobacterium sp.]|nr:N-acetylmuramoyl-L-alanine amidase [Phascolarctobacterium sp.]
MRKIFLLALFTCLLLATAVAQAAAQITDVKWGVDKNNVLRLVVDVTDNAGYAVQLGSSTLKLTVNAKTAGQVQRNKKIKSSIAEELRVLDKDSYTEVLVPLRHNINADDYKAFVLKKDPQTGRPFRVVLDITADKKAATTSGPAVSANTTNKTVVSNKPVVTNRPSSTRPLESGTVGRVVDKQKTTSTSSVSKENEKKTIAKEHQSATVKVSTKSPSKQKKKKQKDDHKKTTTTTATSSNTSNATKTKELPAVVSKAKFRTSGGLKDKRITIDPGHGGSDPGAIGASGLKEKQVTLAISMLVKEQLEKEGAKVYMTRTTDVDVCGPNASDRDELQARVNVAEKNESDLFISIHINSSVNKNVGGFSSYYYPKTEHDLRIAKAIQNKLAANFGVDNLGVRQANFYVVKRSSMPATLLELCFISNAREESLMKGKWFQKKAARMIVEGIEKYFD